MENEQMLPPMNFSNALGMLKQGAKLTRQGWNGKGMWVEMQYPGENSKMTRPYLFMNVPAGATHQWGNETCPEGRVPWLPSQTDLIAEDWVALP